MKKVRDEKQWALPDLEFSAMILPMMKSMRMKMFFAVSSVFALAHVAVAATVVRVDAPPPAHADMEVSAESAMPLPARLTRTFKLTLSLDATATNNAEVVFGTGTCDEPEDIAVVIGFDRGAWFLRGEGLQKQFASPAAAPTAAVRRTLTVWIRLDDKGEPVGVKLHADGAPVTFAGLDDETLLAWLDPRGWGAFRVTSRGGAGNVTASVNFFADGSVFILR